MQERQEMHGVEANLKEQWISVLVDIVSVRDFYYLYFLDGRRFAMPC